MLPASSRTIVWTYVAVAASIVVVALWWAGIAIDVQSGARNIGLFALCGAICLGLRTNDGSLRSRLVDIIELITLFGLVCLLGALGSYVVAALTTGYQDEVLARADAMLGFDWVALYRRTEASGLLIAVGKIAYSSLSVSAIVLFCLFAWWGQITRAHRFLVTYGLTLTCTVIIFAFFPSKGPLVQYIGGEPSYMPASGIAHVAFIDGLRDRTIDIVSISGLHGLIAFPSFHAAGAILYIWGFWQFRTGRVVAFLVNLAMLGSTLVEGVHYLIDVVGGIAVALFAIAAVSSTWQVGSNAEEQGKTRLPSAQPSGAALELPSTR
jgi:membrane-associated phospholipid phosphatase